MWRLPPSANKRLHWTELREVSEAFRSQIYWSVREMRIPAMERIFLTFEAASIHPPDLDNLCASAKPLIDGLILANIIPDDNPDYLVRLTLVSRRARTKSDENAALIVEEAD